MRTAVADGIVTDRVSDGVCEQLVSEGWLERAESIAVRPHVNRANAYLPTDKAMREWNQPTAGQPDSKTAD
jgi:hypothetical protein